jgi:hypothetical protein
MKAIILVRGGIVCSVRSDVEDLEIDVLSYDCDEIEGDLESEYDFLPHENY